MMKKISAGTTNTDARKILSQLRPVATHSGLRKSTLNVKASKYLPRLSTGPGHLMSILSESEKNCKDSIIFFKLFVA